ncbi:hemagglutinin repeat-containing protein [Leptothrix sp. BB-4]
MDTVTQRSNSQSTTAQASELGGKTVAIRSAGDTRIQGSNVLADQRLDIDAGGDLRIEAAQNTRSSSNFDETTKSGLLSSGGIGFSIGSQRQSSAAQDTRTTTAASTVGAIGGDVILRAGRAYTQTGSDVLTPEGNIDIAAKTVSITEARESGSQSTEQKFRQSGLTLSITSPVLSALQTAQGQIQAAGNTGSSRMQALAGANAAMNLMQGADELKAGQSVKDGNAADKAGGVGISVSLGSSSSQSRQRSGADNARGSSVNAGGNITIKATGDGQNSNLTVQGSDIKAAGTTRLQADNEVNLLAAQNTTTESSSTDSKSGSVGVAIQFGAGGGGMGFTASASKATGQGAGNGVSYTNTHVAGRAVNIESGGNTTLKGAVVKADQVTANVGGDLKMESLQDTQQFQESSKSAGGSMMAGAGASGSVNVGLSKIDSQYRSVAEQSAIRAGDGGFQVSVKGNTTLTGAQISSSEKAVQEGRNNFQSGGTVTTTDLQNTASYEAKSLSVGMGTSGGKVSPSGAGVGRDKGSAQSTTTSGISGVAGNQAVRTGDKETGLTAIFNKDQVKAEVNAQVAITSEFGKQASKVVGDYAQTKLAEAEKNNDAAGMETWKEGGASRVALHAVVGGLTGGVQGAMGAASSQAVINQAGQALKEANLPTELKQALVLAAGTAVGAATGGTAGAATAFNATANNYLTHAQLQSKQQQLAACTSDACRKNVTNTWDKVSQSANIRTEDKVLQGSESANLKTMEQLSSDMNGLAQFKSGLETNLRNTADPIQRANLQLQINEADNSMRQVANLGKDTLALMYQQTGNPQYQTAYQALTAATSGNEIAGALTMPGGAGGNLNKAVREAKSGAQIAETAKINILADEAKTANTTLSKTNTAPADSTYVAPTHTSENNFQTHGLPTEQVPASIKNQLTQDLQATFGAGAQDKMKELINSGSSVPVPIQATAETKLYKLVPDSSAYGPKSDSPYFVDGAQLQRIRQNPSLANDILGLPSGSQSTGFKVYEVQPKPDATPTVYQSDVATATNKAGPTAVGNATQRLIPDRSQWTEPKLTPFKIGGQ